MLRNDPKRPSVALTLVLLSFIAGDGLASPRCENATTLELNSIPRSFHAPQEEALRMRVPVTGVLTLELTPTGGQDVEIDVVRDACGEAPADVLVVERTATHLVLAARTAGALYLRVVTPEPDFVLATRFTRARLVVEDVELDGLPVRQTSFLADVGMTKGEPEIVDPDPDGLNVGGRRLLALFLTLSLRD